MSKFARVQQLLSEGKLTAEEIAKKVKVRRAYVHTAKWYMKKKGTLVKPKDTKPTVQEAPKRVLPVQPPHDDAVHHPAHYTHGGIETWDFIDAKELSYHLASVIKYVSRAGKKPDTPELKDLLKAREHLDRRIKQIVLSRKV